MDEAGNFVAISSTAQLINTQNVAIGQTATFDGGSHRMYTTKPQDSVALGRGARAGTNAVAIGNCTAPDGRFVVLGEDYTDVNKRLKKLEWMVKEQTKLIEEQQEMLNAVWYHPGMPGFGEAKEQWKKDILARK